MVFENNSKSSRKFTVISVDPDLQAAQVLQELFENNDKFSLIAQVYSGKEAILKCTALNADIIMIDRNLPDINAIELLKTLMKLCPMSKFVMVAWAMELDWIQSILVLGTNGFIYKPYEAPYIFSEMEFSSRKDIS